MTTEERTRAFLTRGDIVAPYSAPSEHLQDLLLRHDWLLKRQIARGQARKPVDTLGFVAITEPEVQRLLDTRSFDDSTPDEQAIDRTVQQLQLKIEARVEQSGLQDVRLPIVELAKRFALTAREVDLLFACLAVELDRRYERVYGFLHDDMSRRLASTGVALALYCDSVTEQLGARALLNSHAPLRHYRLVEILDDNTATPWPSRSMRIDERIASFLIGETAIDSRIARYIAPLDAAPSGRDRIDELPKRLAQWISALQDGKKPLLYLQGARNAGADTLVRDIALRLRMSVIPIDTELLLDPGADFEQVVHCLFREGLLSQAAVYLRNIDRALEQPNGSSRYRALLRCLADMGSIVFASGETVWCWHLPPDPVELRIVELHPGGFDEQLHVWKTVSSNEFTETELHRLISLQPLPVAAIRDVWRMAKMLAAASEGHTALTPTLEHVQQACRIRAGAPVNSLARRLEPKVSWNDLVLPSAQLEQLSAICSQAKHSSIVYGAWQFDRKLSLGKGLNVLFSGPPGTGKTMAAEVIAADLGVDILKIDLSQIVSKYIGETEKNLRQLFDQATNVNAILFFDEADALLGKRSAVKDAHDRYANTETAYLLQKMEEYQGITILATNLRQNMDEAFTRRMRFIVDFPFPEEADRLRIWQSVWPKEAPLAANVDLPALARQFRLSGGSIRNVALSAAFLAAEQSESVSMQHLMRATRRELQKMGRLVNEEELRRYG